MDQMSRLSAGGGLDQHSSYQIDLLEEKREEI